MSSAHGFVAGLLEVSASGYGGVAASLLLDKDPALADRWGRDAFGAWKGNLTQRILELAAAIRIQEPAVFVARVDWARRSLRAREMPVDDLATSLEALRESLGQQLPEAAGTIADEYLTAALGALAEPAVDESPALQPETANHRLALSYLAAVLEGDPRRGLELVVGAVDEGLDVIEACLDVLLPAQREIGRLWHQGSASVAEEHFVTATTHRVLALLMERAARAEWNGKRALVAAVEGNVHEVAIRILADLLEIDGWQVIYLGASVPNGDMTAAAAGYAVDLVVLSGSLTTQVRQLEDAVGALKRLDSQPAVLVGGAAFDAAPELWRRLGADGYSPTLDDAVQRARELVT